MDRLLSVVQITLPIFCVVFLGVLARKKAMFSQGEIQSFQRLVIQFCLPCLLFQSCLTAELGTEALTGLLLPPALLLTGIWGFRVGRKWFPYHNIPFAFCCKETGMLGIPMFVILFGAEQAYRLGILDLMQAVVVYPVMAILSAAPGTSASPKSILKQMSKSPLILMSLAGLILNLSGAWDWMQNLGMDGIVTATFSYVAQPVSVLMLFCVGYNFTMTPENTKEILKVSGVHFGMFLLVGGILQGLLCFFPHVDPLTRWAFLLYALLPTSFLMPSFGRTERDCNITSGACSLLTAVTLVVFCIIAALVS